MWLMQDQKGRVFRSFWQKYILITVVLPELSEAFFLINVRIAKYLIHPNEMRPADRLHHWASNGHVSNAASVDGEDSKSEFLTQYHTVIDMFRSFNSSLISVCLSHVKFKIWLPQQINCHLVVVPNFVYQWMTSMDIIISMLYSLIANMPPSTTPTSRLSDELTWVYLRFELRVAFCVWHWVLYSKWCFKFDS